MAVDDTYEMRLIHRHVRSQNAVTVRHWRVSITQGIPPTMQEIANSIEAVVQPLLTACVAADWSYVGWKIRQVYPTPTQLIPQAHAAIAGGLVGESLPTQVAGVISMRSQSAPPRSRGRIFVPCPTEVESGSGAPIASLQTKYAALADRLLQPVTVNGAQGGACTLSCGIWKRTAGVFFYPFTSRVVRANFGTQRRRSSINRSDALEF